MKEIILKLNCGETSCSPRAGEWCQFLRQRADGFDPNCHLFGKPVYDDDRDIRGFLQRLPECLAVEFKEYV